MGISFLEGISFCSRFPGRKRRGQVSVVHPGGKYGFPPGDCGKDLFSVAGSIMMIEPECFGAGKSLGAISMITPAQVGYKR